jgi:DNA repair protein RecN (Recombination protein N)
VLIELAVSDLGIIDELSLVLGGGLTAVTGETGAGKTLVVAALELIAGARADAAVVRPGAAEARVEARFEDPHTGEETVLARVVPLEGRSRAYVDGRLATAGELAARAETLLALHGQHSHQTLATPAAQRAALDAFAGAPALDALVDYRAARGAVRDADDRLAALGGDARARAREIALLEHEVEEIASAGLTDPEEDAALEAREGALADAAAHREALGVAYTAIEGPAEDAVGQAVAALADRTPFAALAQRLRALQAELADVAHDLRATRDATVEDPEQLDGVRARRRLLRELQRKYGATLAEVVEYGTASAARLDELRHHEARALELELARADAEARVDAAAEVLHAARVDAAGALAAAVEDGLRRLALPGARLGVEVERAEPTDDGADQVTFMLAANPGEPFHPLARVASGGELSRTLLAVRVALAARVGLAETGVFVFDEVDAGIGGEAGAAVGRELHALAADSQVLCVTHLAQVAACARTQIAVRKAEEGGRTIARAAQVEGELRVAELSRMLAGVEDSDHARRHAAELLSQAPGGRG